MTFHSSYLLNYLKFENVESFFFCQDIKCITYSRNNIVYLTNKNWIYKNNIAKSVSRAVSTRVTNVCLRPRSVVSACHRDFAMYCSTDHKFQQVCVKRCVIKGTQYRSQLDIFIKYSKLK